MEHQIASLHAALRDLRLLVVAAFGEAKAKERLQEIVEAAIERVSTEPAKRGPGRPRKDAAAAPATQGRRQRRPRSAASRLKQAERMKAYWVARKSEEGKGAKGSANVKRRPGRPRKSAVEATADSAAAQ